MGANLDETPDPISREFDKPRLLFVGKDFNRKGGQIVMHAFQRLRHMRPEAELLIVGNPSNLPPATRRTALGTN